MNGKEWYQSKTILANIVSLIAALLALFGLDLDAETKALIVSILASAGPLINVWLRTITTTGIKK